LTVSVVKNMGASVRQRLLNYAKANNRPFAEVLQYYTMERFLYRLSASPHASKFLLKGALLLTAWRAPMSRPTMDIDLLGRTSNEVDDIVNLLKDVAHRADERKRLGGCFNGALGRSKAIERNQDAGCSNNKTNELENHNSVSPYTPTTDLRSTSNVPDNWYCDIGISLSMLQGLALAIDGNRSSINRTHGSLWFRVTLRFRVLAILLRQRLRSHYLERSRHRRRPRIRLTSANRN